MEEKFIIALIGGLAGSFIGGIISLIIFYYNSKKERFFNIQKKGEELLKKIYLYQEYINTYDINNDNVNFKSELIKIESHDKIKTNENYSNFKESLKKLEEIGYQKQRIREDIWVLINVYFPFLENNFREYTNIEVNHYLENKNNTEIINNQREELLNIIADNLIKYINNNRI